MFVGVIILMYYGYFVGISGSLCKALRAEKRLEWTIQRKVPKPQRHSYKTKKVD